MENKLLLVERYIVCICGDRMFYLFSFSRESLKPMRMIKSGSLRGKMGESREGGRTKTRGRGRR